MPGIDRVGIAVPKQAFSYGLATTFGYGFTESLYVLDGAHHRGTGTLAGSISPMRFLELGVRADARYDKHADPESNDGWVFEPRLAVRASTMLTDTLYLGGELGVWIPGSEGTSTSFEGTTPEAKLLFGRHTQRLTLGALAGFRLDRSKAAGADAERLNPGDRAVLGVSEFNSVLTGIGLAYRVSKLELLLETSADVLIGSGAPPFSNSPLRAAAGMRVALSERLSLELLGNASLSSRPGIGPTDPLVPIEPRLSIFAGLRYRFVESESPHTEQVKPPDEKQEQERTESEEPATAQTTIVEVRLEDSDGEPIADAEVTLESGDKTETLTPDGKGNYRLDKAPLGPAILRVRGEGIQPSEQKLELRPGTPAKIDVRPPAALPSGQVRGLVRSFGGKGLAANVRVEPGGIETKTSNDGSFQVDVPPGAYEVTIQCPGYVAQKRKVKVEKNGVVILNADLVKAR